MGASPVKTALGVVGILCAALLLTGCSPDGTANPTPSVRPSGTAPKPSASAPPDKVDDVLFTISANVRGIDGSRIGITMSGHTPVAYSDEKVLDLKKEFLTNCGSDAGGPAITEKSLAQGGTSLMRVALSSTTIGETFAAPLELFLGSRYFPRTASGDGIVALSVADGCYGRYAWGSAGTAHGIADFQNGNGTSVPDLTQWRYGLYGFTVLNPSATIEACKVVISTLGKNAGLDGIPGWDTSQVIGGTSCGIGYSGE